MDFYLRQATLADAEAVARVYVASWNEGFADLMPPRVLNPEQVARWSRVMDAGPVRWRLAESGGSIIGFVGTGPSRDLIEPDLGEIDTIAVVPSAWRLGVGRRLMNSAIDELRDAGYLQGIFWTLADYMQGRNFYEATGWRSSGEVRDSGRQLAFRRVLIG